MTNKTEKIWLYLENEGVHYNKKYNNKLNKSQARKQSLIILIQKQSKSYNNYSYCFITKQKLMSEWKSFIILTGKYLKIRV